MRRTTLAVALIVGLAAAVVLGSSSSTAEPEAVQTVDSTTTTTTTTTEAPTTTSSPTTVAPTTTTTVPAPPPPPPPAPVSCNDFSSHAEGDQWIADHAGQYDMTPIDSDHDGKACRAVCYTDCEPEPAPESTPSAGTTSSTSPSPAAPQPSTSVSGSVWDRLAQCEAGGNWATNTGNGYYGGLQFAATSWTGFGGTEFAPMAHQASRSQQIVVAERILAKQGWRAWPACSRKLGLR